MIIQKEIRDLIKIIAKKHDLPFETAREIIYSQFKFLRKEIEKGSKEDTSTYKNVLLKYLGTFHVTERKINFLNKKKNEEHN